VLPYLDLDQSRGLPGGVAVLIPRVIRRGLLICGCQLDMARKRGRTDACVLYGDPPGAAYRRPRRRCCCPRRLVRPRLFGKDPKRVAFTWRSPAAGKDTASPGSRTGPPTKSTPPRRFHSVARLTMRGSTASTPTNIQPHVYVCVGFRDHIVQRMEFDDHEDHAKNWNDTNDCAC